MVAVEELKLSDYKKETPLSTTYPYHGNLNQGNPDNEGSKSPEAGGLGTLEFSVAFLGGCLGT